MIIFYFILFISKCQSKSQIRTPTPSIMPSIGLSLKPTTIPIKSITLKPSIGYPSILPTYTISITPTRIQTMTYKSPTSSPSLSSSPTFIPTSSQTQIYEQIQQNSTLNVILQQSIYNSTLELIQQNQENINKIIELSINSLLQIFTFNSLISLITIDTSNNYFINYNYNLEINSLGDEKNIMNIYNNIIYILNTSISYGVFNHLYQQQMKSNIYFHNIQIMKQPQVKTNTIFISLQPKQIYTTEDTITSIKEMNPEYPLFITLIGIVILVTLVVHVVIIIIN